MTQHGLPNSGGGASPDWQDYNAELQDELTYIEAERAGVKIDNRPLEHTLKVEEFSRTAGPARAIYSMIRLKGRWLAKIFPPNTRVVVETGEDYMTLRKDS